ncbi:pilus assembly protein FimV [Pseudomonas benzenivorans]|nr:FimV/HubP family polar landmark protein [Pseudomonas benzenivorans]SDG78182.1 pilus assembly protein FimV [Pseudomonas benzenivorans]
MTRVRQLLLGLASGSAFYSGVVPALGLGEITLHSALNQPLEAEIELLQVADLSADDLAVRLAPAEVFNRSGVDRLVFLNDLRFTPLLRGGNSVIRVVSSQPVREPYLNFIVEVARPNGQLLREYTILLDPPGSAAYRAVAAAPQVAETAVRSAASATSATFVAPATLPAAELGQRYRVASGDSLWTIAKGLRAAGSSASQQALMRDIQALNPQAFSNGDSNRLRAGAELVLPDAAAPLERAVAPIAGAQAAAPAAQPVDPQVEAIAQAQRRVDQELASQAAENAQLQQSLAALQVQLQQLQAQMSDKDRQLATLQALLAERQAPPQAPAAAAPVVAEEPAALAPDAAAAVPGARWIGAGAAALLVLLAALLGLAWRRRRQAAPQQRQEQPAAEPVVAAPKAVAPPPRIVPTPAPRRVAEVSTAPLVRPVSTTDALEGANIYIAYGRFSEAAAILRKALQAQPQRSDIRFRLLEVLAQQGDAQAFLREEALLRDSGFTAARIDQLKAQYREMLATAKADPLDDLLPELDEELPAPPANALVDDDFQLNLDDLSLDADWDLVSPFSPGTRKKSAAASLPMEQSTTLDELPAVLELDGDRDVRSPFAESMLVEETSADGWLPDELHESFGDGALLGDLDQLAGSRDNLAKLNLALAYIEQGNLESACNILNEVISEGDEAQRQEARELLARIA